MEDIDALEKLVVTKRTCKIDVCHDECCNDLFEYYRKVEHPVAEALRGQARFLEWHVDLLRKLAEEVERFGEEDLELDVEDLTITGPSELVQRLIDENWQSRSSDYKTRILPVGGSVATTIKAGDPRQRLLYKDEIPLMTGRRKEERKQ